MGTINNDYGPPGNPYTPDSWLGGLVRFIGQFGGRLVSGLQAEIPEVRGLGNISTRWPNVRIIDSPEEHIQADHSHVVVNFKVPWLDRGAFIAELTGWPYITPSGYKRHLPEYYQNWTFEIADNWMLSVPSTPVMYCTSAVAKGLGLRPDWVTQNPGKSVTLGNYYPDPYFEWAVVTAVFETLAYDVFLLSELVETPDRPAEMQRYCVKTEDSNGRFLQFATGVWQLQNPDNLSEFRFAGNRNVNFWESYETVVYEWFDVLPTMTNHARNQRLCGLTNSVTFDNYDPETLLLQRASRIPRRSQFGQRIYNYRFELLHVPTGVNKALPPGLTIADVTDPLIIDPLTGQPKLKYWNIVSVSDTNRKPYFGADLTLLFKP